MANNGKPPHQSILLAEMSHTHELSEYKPMIDTNINVHTHGQCKQMAKQIMWGDHGRSLATSFLLTGNLVGCLKSFSGLEN